ncbi:pseudouridine synthase [Alterisphingorhabdus coralli]|uniref:Pseudouridine synthase n=1 Tax=Alterisphingorhabdus coralli TaxID=3071408 RepID=A0AA97I0J8_9SPHN|nr:pseudouridine synthase [Parasphingorhabdus sp. SCSIO 66989]WOE73835.1 pseudouridine synthase [Parasphingorhabdus sp. SCSIO 66989]
MTSRRPSSRTPDKRRKSAKPQARDAGHIPRETGWSPFDDGPAEEPSEAPKKSKPRPKKPAAPRAKTDSGEKKGDRIAKLLARAGVASRREIERMIADNRIALHGEIVTTPATLLTSLHGVTVDGKAIKQPEPTKLWCFHKPVGTLTAERDFSGRKTIYDTLKETAPDLPRVVPIGRLDLNTEGLLLLTNDGGFKREMELPATGVKRTYRARTFGDVSQDQLEELIDGVVVDGMRYGRIDANLERRTGRNQWIEITLREGKNREVRNVLKHLGLEVSRLIRTSYGPFTIGDLQPGDVSAVRKVELVKFRQTLEKLNR